MPRKKTLGYSANPSLGREWFALSVAEAVTGAFRNNHWGIPATARGVRGTGTPTQGPSAKRKGRLAAAHYKYFENEAIRSPTPGPSCSGGRRRSLVRQIRGPSSPKLLAPERLRQG
jgi:hypothetical protein